jgi:hypothetical protein
MTSVLRRWWRLAQVALAVAVIGLAVRHLVRNWAEFRAQQVEVTVKPIWLVLAFLTVLGTFAMLIETWRRVVVSQGERLPPVPAARIWLLANLGKYLPGKIWAIAGAAVLAERAGVRRTVAITAALVLQALAFGSGVVVVASTSRAFHAGGSWLAYGTGILGAGALAAVALLCIRPALTWVQRRLPAAWPTLEPVRAGVAMAGLAVNAVAWGGYGASLVFLARGLMPNAVPDWRLATAVFTSSYLVGLIALFAPAGLGPRESMFILLLSGPLGLKPAVGLAAASRILFTLAELGLAIPFLLRRPGGAGTPPKGPAS